MSPRTPALPRRWIAANGKAVERQSQTDSLIVRGLTAQLDVVWMYGQPLFGAGCLADQLPVCGAVNAELLRTRMCICELPRNCRLHPAFALTIPCDFITAQ